MMGEGPPGLTGGVRVGSVGSTAIGAGTEGSVVVSIGSLAPARALGTIRKGMYSTEGWNCLRVRMGALLPGGRKRVKENVWRRVGPGFAPGGTRVAPIGPELSSAPAGLISGLPPH